MRCRVSVVELYIITACWSFYGCALLAAIHVTRVRTRIAVYCILVLVLIVSMIVRTEVCRFECA